MKKYEINKIPAGLAKMFRLRFSAVLPALIALFFCGCNYLDVVPENVHTIDDMFADRFAAEKMLASCYWAAPRLGFDWNNNPALMGSMETILNKELRTTPTLRIGLGEDNVTNPVMSYWNGTNNNVRSLYAGIRDCNTFLDNVGSVEDLPEFDKKRMIAEIKLLKAYMHFNLIRFYGPICPLRESLPVGESINGVRVYREKIDECFQYVLDLINEAIENNMLPPVIISTGTELGRFTQSAALFMKAKTLVYWASPLFNGNTDYNSFLDPRDNKPFFNQTENPNRWTEAAEACKAAVAFCESNGYHKLYQTSDFSPSKPVSDEYLLMQSYRNAITARHNRESVWCNPVSIVRAQNNGGYQSECMPRFQMYSVSNPCLSRWSVPLQTVEVFYTDHGVPIEEDREWVLGADKRFDNRFKPRKSDDAHKQWVQINEESATMNFDREIRFYASLGFDRGKWYANGNNNYPDNELDCAVIKARYGEYSAGAMTNAGAYNATGYWPKKLVCLETNFTTTDNLYGGNIIMPEFRYADLLLMTAEALNESKATPDAEVYRYIDLIRARVGLEGIVESYNKYALDNLRNKPATKVGMRAIIQRERTIELAFEGQYHWDVRRWKTALTTLNRPIQGWTITERTADGYYNVNTVYFQRFGIRDYFMPIPESDRIINPYLVQNVGW